ncbi:gamma-glutamyltransferase family protein [Pararhodobacter zhoushanensis]|uniref:Gamma-glutamyltransferase family protein n=1 Tax=Pararhodobacter zhoushanensis TaxID=2479545 RepID=A0ABT3GXD7_9RHOB|nr:gamma-glutamyltransferase family protein [Pararhodobacter zhoushanensis]MCW1932225.1 gamma-glutamyltransferase family protein [Pararhodobacter zhoushanensis]
MSFTTRPELSGTFGMTSSTHWIASAVGMSVLERGGNAYDAAVAMGFTLHVCEPHLNGPLGDMPAMIWPADDDQPTMICGQATAPAGATITHYRDQGLDLIPGSGLLATVIPGAFDAWMLMLRDHGTWPLADVLAPAIDYARNGVPMLANATAAIAGLADFFRDEWPTSAAVWLPDNAVPKAGALFCNPDLAATWERLCAEVAGTTGREAQIDAARKVFSQGFIAQAIDDWMRDAHVMDASGARHKGVLTGQDMAGWSASYEPALTVRHAGWQVYKGGFWSQGPVLLQVLQTLAADPLAAMDPTGPQFVHLVTEALKLAFADREAHYGDPADAEIPAEILLSRAHGLERRALITERASDQLRPSMLHGFEGQADAAVFRQRWLAKRADNTGPGIGEPTMGHLKAPGDTVHLDVVDRWGNMVSATPSGGWLQSSPVVPGLGMPLNSRAQMFWLDDGLPSSLAPGRRPRTTLSPSFARGPDGTRVAFGTPGGDQQDQWQSAFLLRLIHHGMNLQEAIDAPLFHTEHLQASFDPRGFRAAHLLAEPAFPEATLQALRDAGHDLQVAAPWSAGRLTAVSRRPDGLLRAAATPRLMQAYAVGR